MVGREAYSSLPVGEVGAVAALGDDVAGLSTLPC